MKFNLFSEQVNWDEKIEDKLKEFYNSLFPDLIKIVKIKKGSNIDKEGIDRILELKDKKIFIQEKIRDKDWGDLLVEFVHSKNKTDNPWKFGKRGWYFKLKNVHLLFYIVPNKIYVVNSKKLRKFIIENWKEIKKRDWKIAWNPEGSYYTYNKSIGWEEINPNVYKF